MRLNRWLCPNRPLIPVLVKIFIALLVLIGAIIVIRTGIAFSRNLGIKGRDVLNAAKDPSEFIASTDGLTNFLILGIRGESVDAPDLTDTMIVASFHHLPKKITLLSIARDLWVPSLRAKINSAYHFGEEKATGSGLISAKGSTQEVIGIPIHYTVLLNFQGFVDFIDLIGGVDINVKNPFVDHLYPIPGKENSEPESSRYQMVEFRVGQQTLTGDMALKFVRSRHAQGPEGTDFARSARQHQVITAIKDKVLSTNLLLNPEKQKQALEIFKNNFLTDITPDLFPVMIRLALESNKFPVENIDLSTEKTASNPAILENPPSKNYFGQWVLIPKDGNYQALSQYIRNKLKD